ncbi:MAG: hypothetical protein M3Q69_14980, partial [Acidobacteriota bacterium]|nr:hypothetical protein [Acidobacteriota bacterium]
SNLDWGQDLFRLAAIVDREHLDPLYISYFGSADWKRHMPNAQPLPPAQCTSGWIAVSEMQPLLDTSPAFDWLRRFQPVRRVGASIRLYFIPESACGGR